MFGRKKTPQDIEQAFKKDIGQLVEKYHKRKGILFDIEYSIKETKTKEGVVLLNDYPSKEVKK